MKLRTATIALLLPVSLLMTASCALTGSGSGGNPSPLSVLKSVLTGQSSETLSSAEQEEIREAIKASYPTFPAPTLEAIQAIRKLNNPALNRWVQDLTILCQQLEEDCRDEG